MLFFGSSITHIFLIFKVHLFGFYPTLLALIVGFISFVLLYYSSTGILIPSKKEIKSLQVHLSQKPPVLLKAFLEEPAQEAWHLKLHRGQHTSRHWAHLAPNRVTYTDSLSNLFRETHRDIHIQYP